MVFGDEHDYKTFPELTNVQLEEFGFDSPHVQIIEDFEAVIVKVHDGDTVSLHCDFRDFDFPLRFALIDAPELSTGDAGLEARDYLAGRVLGELVEVRLAAQRVEKYGRLLGDVFVGGANIGEEMINYGYALPFDRRREGEIPDLNKTLAENKWF